MPSHPDPEKIRVGQKPLKAASSDADARLGGSAPTHPEGDAAHGPANEKGEPCGSPRPLRMSRRDQRPSVKLWTARCPFDSVSTAYQPGASERAGTRTAPFSGAASDW